MNANRHLSPSLLMGLGLAGALAASASPPPWVGTIPAQTSLCVKGTSALDHELDDQDLALLYRAAKGTGLQAIGYPFVGRFERTGEPENARHAWTICAPIAGVPAHGAGAPVEPAEATPAAFLFCAGEPRTVARRCAGDLLEELSKLGAKPSAIARSVPVPPVDEAALRNTVERLMANTAAIRLDAPAPEAGAALEMTDLDRQLQGQERGTRVPRPFYTGGGFNVVAGGAVPQQGVTVFVALTQAEADTVSKALNAPPAPHDPGGVGGGSAGASSLRASSDDLERGQAWAAARSGSPLRRP